jgi:hypothetical protein
MAVFGKPCSRRCLSSTRGPHPYTGASATKGRRNMAEESDRRRTIARHRPTRVGGPSVHFHPPIRVLCHRRLQHSPQVAPCQSYA